MTEVPDTVRSAITEYPDEAAEFLASHFPAVIAYERLQEDRKRKMQQIRQPVESTSTAVKAQAATARKNAALLLSMVRDGDFDSAGAGLKQEVIVDLVIAAEQLEKAVSDLKSSSNEILERN